MTIGARIERLKERWSRAPRGLQRAGSIGWRALPWLAIVAVLGWIHGPALAAHVKRSAEPLIYNDDVRILIHPFYRSADPSLFPGDRLTDYYGESLPDGYRLLYAVMARLWDAAAFSKLLPYLLLAVLLAALAAGAHRLAGRAAAFGVLALSLGSEVFMDRMAGGLPRAFTFPILAAAAAALIYGHAWLLAALVCIGAAFYPVTGVIVGLSLGGMLLVLPANHRGQAEGWSLRRRVVFLAGTALAAALVLAPAALRLRQWGEQIRPADFGAYPEAGPGGRFQAADRPPFPPFHEAAPPVMRKTVVGGGEPIVEAPRAGLSKQERIAREDLVLGVLLAAVLIGFARLCWHRVEARRLLLLGAAAYVGHFVANLVTPSLFLPQRYVYYVVPILTALLAGTCFAGLWPKAKRLERWAFAPVLAGNLLVLALIGGRGGTTTGLSVVVRADERALYDRIASLPKDVLIAGWPSVLDNVPYLAKRAVLLSWEMHMPFHKGFTDMTRMRMNALIDAYFATSPEPLLRLRDELGVTHLVVSAGHLHQKPPRYFRPFDVRVREALARAKGQTFEVERQRTRTVIYERGDIAILDLSRLEPAAPAP